METIRRSFPRKVTRRVTRPNLSRRDPRAIHACRNRGKTPRLGVFPSAPVLEDEEKDEEEDEEENGDALRNSTTIRNRGDKSKRRGGTVGDSNEETNAR